MPLNLELKLKVLSHSDLITRLEQIGAEYKGILNQRDVYFIMDGALLKLRVMDSFSELIKYNRNEDGGTRWSDYSVLRISDVNAEDFLKQIFKVEVIVTKKRELWMFDNTRIHLDAVESLGSYLELETLVINGREDAQKRFDKIVDLLNLDLNDQILMSYRDLLLMKGSQ